MMSAKTYHGFGMILLSKIQCCVIHNVCLYLNSFKTQVCLFYLICLIFFAISLFKGPQKSKDHKAEKILFSFLKIKCIWIKVNLNATSFLPNNIKIRQSGFYERSSFLQPGSQDRTPQISLKRTMKNCGICLSYHKSEVCPLEWVRMLFSGLKEGWINIIPSSSKVFLKKFRKGKFWHLV